MTQYPEPDALAKVVRSRYLPPMSIASDLEFGEIGFTVGRCSACAREVLTYPALDSDTGELYCVHCDAAVTEGIRTTTGSELPDHGYGLLELQGCGNPDCGGGACSRMASEAESD